MGKQRTSLPPATTEKAREDQLIAKAFNLVEQRMDDGSITGGELVQIIKWGSERERMEKEKLSRELALMEAKTEALQSSKNMEKLFTDAIEAMKTYRGSTSDEDI